ncbi:MAG: ImmA/IrrE family metallo-endopeptidase [Lachnospiraceae bacterium]|nr:ImmA/IrrE family metallo-endopeptidase [Lachnospiraceae bacterium]
MCKALDNSLFVQDRERFERIREKADGFNKNFNGDNIIQDDIFHIIENYSRKKAVPLELLRYPIEDEELCACTFIREGRIFVLLNAGMQMAKQIFAVAHELYHVWCYLEDEDQDLICNGSLLDSATIDDAAGKQEEMEANAFSGLLLVPADTLNQQIRIYGINKNNITVPDILMLMEIFGVPYKAMILRLYEDSLISEEQARTLFRIPGIEVQNQIEMTGRAKRWSIVPHGIEKFGSLMENMAENIKNGALTSERMDSDRKRLQEIYQLYHIK